MMTTRALVAFVCAAGPEMTGRDALDECIKDLDVAIEIRVRRSHAQLAEALQVPPLHPLCSCSRLLCFFLWKCVWVVHLAVGALLRTLGGTVACCRRAPSGLQVRLSSSFVLFLCPLLLSSSVVRQSSSSSSH